MLCILYVNAVGLLLGLIAMQLERLLPVTTARRWLWCVTILLSTTLPGYYRFHHNLAVAGTAGGTMMTLDAGDMRHIAAVDGFIQWSWLASSLVLGVWTLINAGWIAGVVHTSRRRRTISRLDGVPVVVTDSFGPATVGVLRKRVILPRWVLGLPDAQRQYIVKHEDEHRRSSDSTILAIASLTVLIAPWNLAMWWQLRRLALAIELDCDRRVVSSLGDAHAYGNLLLTVAQATVHGPRMQPALAGRAGMLERRLTALLHPSPLRVAERVMLPLLMAVLLALVLMAPHPMIADQMHAPAHAGVR